VTAKILWHLLSQNLRHACVVARGLDEAVVGVAGILGHSTREPLSSFRLVIPTDAVDSPGFQAHAARLRSHGCEVRVLDDVDMDVVVLDRTLAIPLSPPQIVSDARAVRRIATATDAVWARAQPLPADGVMVTAAALPPRAAQVLRLLAEGLTDEAVARRLGVSVRTVRNDVAATMGRVDTTSRFQMGARAAHLGLI